MAYSALLWPGKENTGGLLGPAFWCPISDISTFPVLAAAGGPVTTTASITCVATKKFYTIYGTDESMKVEINSIGDKDGFAWETMLSWNYPGSDSTVMDMLRQMANVPAVVIYKDNGIYRIMGMTNSDPTTTVLNADIPCYMDPSVKYESGDKRDKKKGTNFAFRWRSNHPPVQYLGAAGVPIV